jgi:MFS family permease
MMSSYRRRYFVFTLLFFLTLINYIDRQLVPLAQVSIGKEFGLNAAIMGVLLSAHLWAYVLFLLPWGLLIDRLGTRLANALSILIWSIAVLLAGVAPDLGLLLVARVIMGAGEAATFPAAAKVTREWAPAGERGAMTALWNSGAYAGPAVGALLVTWLLTFSDWRMPFHIMTLAGLAWLAVWWLFFRQPEEARWLTDEERQHILRTRAPQDQGPARGGYLALMRNPTLWVIAVLQGAAAYTQYMILSWLPGYLATERGLDATSTGLLSAIPFFVAALLGFGIGFASDKWAKRASSPVRVRRLFLTTTLAISVSILFMPIVPNDAMVVVVMSVSLTCVGASIALNLSLANDLLADSGFAARVSSFVVLGGNLFGLAAPIVTGFIVQATGLFAPAFITAGVILVVASTLALTATRKPIAVAAVGTADQDRPGASGVTST